MKAVSDKIFIDTVNRVKEYINISPNPTNYKLKVLINLMPTFAFGQLIVFLRIGEYLKTQGFFVDYFICDGVFNHCDMVKMNEEMDKDLLCERCIFASKNLGLKRLEFSQTNVEEIDQKHLSQALIRYLGEGVTFHKYKRECEENLKLAASIKMDYDFLISLTHFQDYTLFPFVNNFKKQLFLSTRDGKIFLFGVDKKVVFEQNLDFNDKLLKRIENYFQSRIKFTNNLELDTDKKVVSFFPNIVEDAFENDNNVIFDSMIDWLKESVDYLLKNGFYVIVKAHPSEISWKPVNSVLDYLEDNENLLKIPANSDINAYDVMKRSDFICVHNGTVFFESLYMGKKAVLGGKMGVIYHKSKEEYFQQFYNYKQYDYRKAMEYGYKILLTKAMRLNMFDKNLPYPHIKKESTDEISFKAIKDIVEDKYDVNKYVEDFVPQY